MAKRTTRTSSASPFNAETRICVLHGPDAMIKRQHLDALRGVLEAAHGEVETFRHDGKSCELADVLDDLRSYSLMQQYKNVIVDDAESFVKTHREALGRYAAAPVDHATLVLRSDRWNRGNLDKAIQKVGTLIKCEALKPAAARTWLIERAKTHHQCALSSQAAGRLIERLGTDLGRLDSEVGKLVLMAGPDQAIDAALINQVVGRSSDEEAYAVQTVLLTSLAAARSSGRGDAAAGPIIEKIHEVVDLSRRSDFLVGYYIADAVRKLHQGLTMKQQGQSPSAIARQLPFWGPSEQAFVRLLGRLDADRTGALFDAAVDADARAKSGFGDLVGNAEGFCVRLVAAMG